MGLYVKDWRSKRGLSQEETARRAGIRQATLSKLENGITTPHRVTLAALAAVLGCRPEDLRKRPKARRKRNAA